MGHRNGCASHVAEEGYRVTQILGGPDCLILGGGRLMLLPPGGQQVETISHGQSKMLAISENRGMAIESPGFWYKVKQGKQARGNQVGLSR